MSGRAGAQPTLYGLEMTKRTTVECDLMMKLIMHAPDLITALIRVLKRMGAGQINYLFILKVLRNCLEPPQR